MPLINNAYTPELYYTISGKGPAIVLIHGFPESGQLFNGLEAQLAEKYTVIIPDLPGAGKSAIGTADSIQKMAECVYHILQAEAITTAVIAGHSMGGYVAFAFAATYPQMVAGLTAIHSTPFADTDEKKAVRSKAISIIEAGGKKAFITTMVTNLFSSNFKSKSPAVIEAQVVQSLKIEADSLINYYKAMMSRADTSTILPNAPYPVQWIMGKQDELMPYKLILERCLLSPVNFVSLYSNCGHMSMFEATEQLLADLLRFSAHCHNT